MPVTTWEPINGFSLSLVLEDFRKKVVNLGCAVLLATLRPICNVSMPLEQNLLHIYYSKEFF
jgi:hypothetical protein